MTKQLQHVMRQQVEDNFVAGVNALVYQDGKEVCYCQEGMADREAARKLERDTIFRLYSQTKPVTAAAAMILMERGQLDLYQPVSDFLPAYRQMSVCEAGKIRPLLPTERPMQVVDLLRMTSGLVYPDETIEAGREAGQVFEAVCDRLDGSDAMTTRQVADALAACPLLFAPGKGWRYGTSADVLGAVIEAVSGETFAAFLQKELFEPLDMEDTGFWVPQEKQDRLAAAYETVILPDGKKQLLRFTGNHLGIRNDMAKEPAFASGGAGLASTLDDYMKFAQMLLRGGSVGKKQLLRPETVRYLTGGQLLDCQQKDFQDWIGLEGHSYANLMRVCRNPAQSGMLTRKGEYGWDGWLGVYFANFPQENLTILFGMQKKDAGTTLLTRRLRNVILSTLME